jgi:hypothetical protein
MPRMAMPDYLMHLRGVLTTALLLLGNSVLHAADDCLTEPKPGATPGRHWYYLTNHTTHRRCWYLARPGTDRARAEPGGAQSAPSSAAPSAVQQLVNPLTGNSETNEQKPSTANATPAEPAGMRGPKPTNAAERPRRAARKVNRVTEHPASLDRTQRDALFRDFLRWKAQQKDHVSE